MNVVGADRLQRLFASGAEFGWIVGAWLAELRDARFVDVADFVSRYPEAMVQPNGAMRLVLGSGRWAEVRLNCSAGVVLISNAGVVRGKGA